MAKTQVEGLLRLLDLAFRGDHNHSLLGNMRHVDDAVWGHAPEGGSRTIAEIFTHAACGNWAYDDAAFRGRERSWDEWLSTAPADRKGALDWAREGHDRLVESVGALEDADLDLARPTHWGGEMETRALIVVTIEHDIYHAGEVNHARALLQNTDRWPGA